MNSLEIKLGLTAQKYNWKWMKRKEPKWNFKHVNYENVNENSWPQILTNNTN